MTRTSTSQGTAPSHARIPPHHRMAAAGTHIIAKALCDGRGQLHVPTITPDGGVVLSLRGAVGTVLDLPALSWSLERKVRLVKAICTTLIDLHDRGLCCGYLWPGNIWLDSDFGPMLRAAGAGGASVEAGEPAHARACYLAPEVRAGQPFDARADAYSVGRILHFVLLGEDPSVVDETLPRLDVLASSPPGLVRIIRKCTCVVHAWRYPSVRELLSDLEGYADDPSVGTYHPASGEQRPEAVPRPRGEGTGTQRRRQGSGLRLKRPSEQEMRAAVSSAELAAEHRTGPSTLEPAAGRGGSGAVSVRPASSLDMRLRPWGALVGGALLVACLALAWAYGTGRAPVLALTIGVSLSTALLGLAAPLHPRRPWLGALALAASGLCLGVLLDPAGALARYSDERILAQGSPQRRAAQVRGLRSVGRQDFSGLALRDVDVSGADLAGTSLVDADLRGANLRGAVLRGAELRGTMLADTDLRGAVLADTRLQDAIGIEHAQCDDTTVVPQGWSCEEGHPARDAGAEEAR
jgi:hypothetical protein